MSKRFLDTGFLDQKWIRKLSPERKIFLIYLMLKCDNGGIIDLDMEDAEFWIGKKITDLSFLPKGYLIPLNGSCKYFMPKFIDWQYRDLSSQKYIIVQARQILEKHGLINNDFTLNLDKNYITITKDVPEIQEQGNGIGNGIGMVKEKEKEVFDLFRKEYPGTKRGLEVEFSGFIKHHKDWKSFLPLLSERLIYQKEARLERKMNKLFVPEWKNLETWINNKSWEDIINTTE
jgi:hypothetical protein